MSSIELNHLTDGSHWLKSYNNTPIVLGRKGVSDLAIAFHSVPPREMYVEDFLIYSLRPYGRSPLHPPPEQEAKNVPPELHTKLSQDKP